MINKRKILSVVIAILSLFGMSNCVSDKEKGIAERIQQLTKDNDLIVQIAELEIDSTQLKTYIEFLQEGILTSVKEEPGVLTLYAMADRDKPNRITVVEIYESQEAYNSHIASPHFLKYKNGTMNMVDSLKLTRTKPIVFAAKGE
ncbi:MAG: antibiotic biosynthesis monooxygenase family protein [Eudoraea sp.]|uniref:putative quinol monooxygenase n=1 Tax=Eudoraea sp. TaxID=1979955 RepID=UPI003C71665F